ncbi:NlpC/P60 family protein [Shimia ponticola]|uniref:NlpC/P60 family protein n=1 Tax=Shimia ponticola TaxID=2582893 RepID=UPI0011BFE6B1|nr:NlpC/P60 family protein [Shimia ponticola]
MSGLKVAEAAREWIGTPYHHQASSRGAGTDCLGLVLGVWRDLAGEIPADVPAYTMDWAEPQQDEALWRAAREHLRELDGPEPGAIVLFRMRDGMVAKHLGVISSLDPNLHFIHAYMRHGVIESPLSTPWQRRVVSYFAFPE